MRVFGPKLLCALAMVALVGCRSERTERAPEPKPTIRLAILTDLKGYLEPCGCTSDPLGGIDRLAAKLADVRKDGVPLAVLLVGDTFFDQEKLRPERAEQEHQKAKTLVDILNAIGVHSVLPGRRDLAQTDQISSLRSKSQFSWLTPTEGGPAAVMTQVAGLQVALVGVGPAPVARAEVREAVNSARGGGAQFVVALATGGRRASQAAAVPGVDLVIQGELDQDDAAPPRTVGETTFLHASRQGQGVTLIDVFRRGPGSYTDASTWSRETRMKQLEEEAKSLESKIAAWESKGNIDPSDLALQRKRLTKLKQDAAALRKPTKPTGNWFSAEFVPLYKKSPRDADISARMLAYDKRVNEHNRVALADLKPPPVEAGEAAYVGSAACAGSSCHQPAYDWWKTHKHGVAYKTLVDLHKEFNLSCVGCHVTGYEEPGGSTVTHLLDGALQNVGCETCHGPGSLHVADNTVPMVVNTPESTCVTCHNEEHSDKFLYDAYKAALRVPGHGLPVK